MSNQRDIANPPTDPQFQLGPTSSDAKMAAEMQNCGIGGPGDIVGRLGYQFEIPAAEPTSMMSERPGNNLGTDDA